MIIGLPGSGKSFFARQFAAMFGSPLVSHDFIRHTLFPESKFTREEDDYVEGLANNQLTELVKTGKTVIIDGGMNTRVNRLTIDRLAQKYDYGKLVIWVQTDEPTSLSRSTKRSAKRDTDALNSRMDAATFDRIKKQFNVPTAAENVVVISGKHTYATQAKVVLKKLVAPREAVEVTHHQSAQRQADSKPEQQHPDVQPRRRVTVN